MNDLGVPKLPLGRRASGMLSAVDTSESRAGRDGRRRLRSTRPLRAPAVMLGLAYLLSIVMLGPLLGSAADASSAFAEHFDSSGNRVRDLVGSVSLLAAAAALGWTVIAARAHTVPTQGLVRDLAAGAGLVTAAALVVAAALLATVPLTASIAELTDDPGIDVAVQAGVAQAGTVTLLVAALCLAVTSVLLARVGAADGAVPRWIRVTSWVVAATLCFGVTVAFLVPFAAWAVAVGLVWSAIPSSQPDPRGR